MVLGGQRHAPSAFRLGKRPVPPEEKAGWAPQPVSLPLSPTVFDPQTVQAVASRYTD